MNGVTFLFMTIAVVMAAVYYYRFKRNVCPKHGEPWCDYGEDRRYCMYYDPELGASEDYGCPQEDEV